MTATYRDVVRTVVLGPRPPELDELIERRRRLGQDGHDEVWQGDYHMAPFAHSWHGFVQNEVGLAIRPLAARGRLVATGSFNLGIPHDFRVPDGGVHDHLPNAVYVATALVVVEVLSPDDESWEKLPFYAGRGVREVLMVDPREATIRCLRVAPDATWHDADRSAVLDVAIADLVGAVTWPRDLP